MRERKAAPDPDTGMSPHFRLFLFCLAMLAVMVVW